jgi:hypothetical protein
LGIANRPTGYEELTRAIRDVKKRNKERGVSEVVSGCACRLKAKL